MSLNRYSKQRDANEPEIIAAFEVLGWRTEQCIKWDLNACCPRFDPFRHVLMVEVKTLKPRGRLTPSQVKLIDYGWPLHIVYEVADVQKLVSEHMKQAHA